MDDPYHKTFAAEEEFIALVTFADPAKTPGEIRGVREFYKYVTGGKEITNGQAKAILDVVSHN